MVTVSTRQYNTYK